MDKAVIIVIQASIIFFSFVYLNRTENKTLKIAIGLFGLAFLSLMLRKLTVIKSIGLIAYIGLYLTSVILFLFYIIKSNDIKRSFKKMIVLIVLTALLLFVFKIFHFPGYGLLILFSILPLCLVFFLNFRKINELREELRMVDLIIIPIIIDLVMTMSIFWTI